MVTARLPLDRSQKTPRQRGAAEDVTTGSSAEGAASATASATAPRCEESSGLGVGKYAATGTKPSGDGLRCESAVGCYLQLRPLTEPRGGIHTDSTESDLLGAFLGCGSAFEWSNGVQLWPSLAAFGAGAAAGTLGVAGADSVSGVGRTAAAIGEAGTAAAPSSEGTKWLTCSSRSAKSWSREEIARGSSALVMMNTHWQIDIDGNGIGSRTYGDKRRATSATSLDESGAG